MLPKISIIIPCYNLGNFLLPCLDSINIQTVKEAEYIFVDDGSTDQTLELLKKFCKDRKDCTIIHQQNRGVSAARNIALKHCKGDYVYLLDGDDILTDNAISLMSQAIKDTHSDVILSTVTIRDEGKCFKKSNPIDCGNYTPTELYNACSVFPTMPQLLYKRSIIEKNDLEFDPSLKVGEVYEFTIRYLNFARSIAVVPDCYFYYVMRHTSASHKPNFTKDLTILNTIRQYYAYGEDYIKYPSFNVTAFKMMMAFTYNKYVKLKLSNPDTYNTIKEILCDSNAKDCIKRVAKSNKSPWKERTLALFVLTTGVIGYKILTKLL